MTDAHYADDQALLTNTPAQAESQFHSSERVAEDIGLYLNENKIGFESVKQEGAISTSSGQTLKVDQFTYPGSNISSTESDFSVCIEKAWTAVDYKEISSEKIIQDFFQAVVCQYYCINAPPGLQWNTRRKS